MRRASWPTWCRTGRSSGSATASGLCAGTRCWPAWGGPSSAGPCLPRGTSTTAPLNRFCACWGSATHRRPSIGPSGPWPTSPRSTRTSTARWFRRRVDWCCSKSCWTATPPTSASRTSPASLSTSVPGTTDSAPTWSRRRTRHDHRGSLARDLGRTAASCRAFGRDSTRGPRRRHLPLERLGKRAVCVCVPLGILYITTTFPYRSQTPLCKYTPRVLRTFWWARRGLLGP
uniref:Uncharacterized protein n=1 Tax=Ixodes ricinus TaxID=34613 RepID=A0A147BQZ3_IXORI